MHFLNSMTPADENLFSLLNENPVSYQDKVFTLSEILQGDSDIAFAFIREQVCSNRSVEVATIPGRALLFLVNAMPHKSHITQVCHYSDWIKSSIRAINMEHPTSADPDDPIMHMTAGLIELVIIKKFIGFSLSADGAAFNQTHHDRTRILFNNLIDKLNPSMLFDKTWEIILCIFMQSFSDQTPYLIDVLTELREKRTEIPYFSHYRTIAECVYYNTLLNNLSPKEPRLIELFLNPKNTSVSEDLKNIFILLCIRNSGRYNLIMDVIDNCQLHIPNPQDRKNNYTEWVSRIEEIFVAIQNEGNFFNIIKSFFDDKHLHPKWFPILSDFPAHDIVFFRLFVACKGSPLHEYIKSDHPDLVKKPYFPMVDEMKTRFGRSYYEYMTDIEWYGLDERTTNEKLCKKILEEEEKSTLPQKAVHNLLEILTVRKAGNLSVFQYFLNKCDIFQYEKLFSHMDLISALPSKIRKAFAESWVSKAKKNTAQIQIIHALKSKIEKHSLAHELIEIKKIFRDHLNFAESMAKKSERELLRLIEQEKEEKKQQQKSKKNKTKNKSAKKAKTSAQSKVKAAITKDTQRKPQKSVIKPEIIVSAVEEVTFDEELKISAESPIFMEEETFDEKSSIELPLEPEPEPAPLIFIPQEKASDSTPAPVQKSPTFNIKYIDPEPQVPVEDIEKKEAEYIEPEHHEPEAPQVAPKQKETPVKIKKVNPKHTKWHQKKVKNITPEEEQKEYVSDAPPLQTAKNNVLFLYGPTVSDASSVPSMDPDLFPPVKINHPTVSVLRSFNRIYKSVYLKEFTPPTLTCYGSAARLLFERVFFKQKDTQLSDDIDLHLYLPKGISDTLVTHWWETLKEYGATSMYCIDGRIKGDNYVQIRFVFENTQIDLSLSEKKLKQVFDLPTIVMNKGKGLIGNFCTPEIFYDARNRLKKIIAFSPDFNYEDLLNPKILSFIWKQAAYLRASEYTYDRSVIHDMTDLQQDLLNQPHIIDEACSLFFNKYFPKNPEFFSLQFSREPVKISTLNPYFISAALQEYVANTPSANTGKRFNLRQ